MGIWNLIFKEFLIVLLFCLYILLFCWFVFVFSGFLLKLLVNWSNYLSDLKKECYVTFSICLYLDNKKKCIACLTSRYLGNKTSVRRWGFCRDSVGCVRRAWSNICPGICCTWKRHNRCVSYTRSYTPPPSGCVLWSSWCLLQLGSSPSADSLGSWECYLF